MKGIDVSQWQKGLSMADVKKAGNEFVILRGGYTGWGTGITKVKDTCFEAFYAQAKKVGLNVGCYHYSCANTKAKGIEEARWLYENCLKGKQFEMPVYIDVEDTHWQAKSKAGTTDAIIGFCETLEKLGFFVGVYASYDWLKNKIDFNRIKKYSIWIAYWTSKKPDVGFNYGMWQNSDSGTIAGHTVDTDVSYEDFPNTIKIMGLNGFKKIPQAVTSAPIKSPQMFYAEYVGKVIDDDGAYGTQCVDGFRVLCKYLGIPVMPTPNNWADGYWTCKDARGNVSKVTKEWQEKYFTRITGPKNFQNGDVVIWARGSKSHPSSHIAMYYLGKEFGENQGGNRGFLLKSTDFNDALGALRPKAWKKESAAPLKNPLDKYTDDELADMVIKGYFGTGEIRKKKLGDRYDAVQSLVNQKLTRKTNEAIAQEVIDGKWGNGVARRNALIKAGYDYNAIQKIVDEKLSNKAVYYTIKDGDTLTSIAKKYGTTISNLKALNGIKNANLIYAGDKIRVK